MTLVSRRLGRALLAFGIFVLIGPAIGSLVFGILVTAVTMVTDPGVGLIFILASIAFVALAYVIGGLQAGFVGLVAAVAIWRTGRARLPVVLAASALAVAYTQARAHEDWGISAIMIVVHLTAAAACWFIVDRLLAAE